MEEKIQKTLREKRKNASTKIKVLTKFKGKSCRVKMTGRKNGGSSDDGLLSSDKEEKEHAKLIKHKEMSIRDLKTPEPTQSYSSAFKRKFL